jgi:hypothetical protein
MLRLLNVIIYDKYPAPAPAPYLYPRLPAL